MTIKKALTLLLICLTLLANSQSSMNMNLLGTYDYPTTQGNDIWGWVDASGNVKLATFDAINSSIADTKLTELAIKAAYTTLFSSADASTPNRLGFITFKFELE